MASDDEVASGAAPQEQCGEDSASSTPRCCTQGLLNGSPQDENGGSADALRQQSGKASVRVKSIGHYILMKTIGEGTFGKVKLGYHILTGERVAVKVLEKDRIVNVDDVGRVAREIHILKLIRRCKHIIQLYEIIETPHQLYLIMEYAEGGELFDYIVKHGRAEEREACRFLHQILAGVERVHEMFVCHRDLKPENLLLDERKDIKIVDFGLSNTYQEGQLLQTACGSPCYAAPEMIAGHMYVPSMVDIWSCGVILFALVCGYLPFEDQNHTELYKKILNADYEMPSFVSKEVADLIAGMLTTDPAQRMTLNDVRQHVWYRQIPEASLRDPEDSGQMDEEILEQLDSYGFPREYAIKCLKTNKHNHVTTTYHLIREKRHRARLQGSKASEAANRVIADLDATGQEDYCNGQGQVASGPQTPAGMAAVAAVATPSRGARGEADLPDSARRRGDGSGLVWPGTSPAAASDAPDSARHSQGPVPRLNLGDLSQTGGSSNPGGHRTSHAVASRSPRGARHGPVTARGAGGCDARSVSPGQPPPHYQGRQMGASPRRPCSGEPPLLASTPRQHPQSARGFSYYGHEAVGPGGPTPRRRRTSRMREGEQFGPRRACSPWGHRGYVGCPDPVADLNMELDSAPLTARPRLQGNSVGCRERPTSSYGGYSQRAGGGSREHGVRASSTRAPPMSARAGYHGHAAPAEGAGEGGPGVFQVSCSSGLGPKQILAEVLRVLSMLGINSRQVSSHLVRCQSQGLRFQAEVLPERSAGYSLRLSRVTGEAWYFREISLRLLGELDL